MIEWIWASFEIEEVERVKKKGETLIITECKREIERKRNYTCDWKRERRKNKYKPRKQGGAEMIKKWKKEKNVSTSKKKLNKDREYEREKEKKNERNWRRQRVNERERRSEYNKNEKWESVWAHCMFDWLSEFERVWDWRGWKS